MKWQSEEHVNLAEAAEWARHFATLEEDMDRLLAELLGVPLPELRGWMQPGRYFSGPDLVEAGLAELTSLVPLPSLTGPPAAPRKRRKKKPSRA
jgi:hypothetical protein